MCPPWPGLLGKEAKGSIQERTYLPPPPPLSPGPPK